MPAWSVKNKRKMNNGQDPKKTIPCAFSGTYLLRKITGAPARGAVALIRSNRVVTRYPG